MNKLITVSGVRGRLDIEGNAELNLEDIARGLGFTENKSGVLYVMWRRVKNGQAARGQGEGFHQLPAGEEVHLSGQEGQDNALRPVCGFGLV